MFLFEFFLFMLLVGAKSSHIFLLSNEGILALDLFRGTVFDPTAQTASSKQSDQAPDPITGCLFSEVISTHGTPLTIPAKKWSEAQEERKDKENGIEADTMEEKLKQEKEREEKRKKQEEEEEFVVVSNNTNKDKTPNVCSFFSRHVSPYFFPGEILFKIYLFSIHEARTPIISFYSSHFMLFYF